MVLNNLSALPNSERIPWDRRRLACLFWMANAEVVRIRKPRSPNGGVGSRSCRRAGPIPEQKQAGLLRSQGMGNSAPDHVGAPDLFPGKRRRDACGPGEGNAIRRKPPDPRDRRRRTPVGNSSLINVFIRSQVYPTTPVKSLGEPLFRRLPPAGLVRVCPVRTPG
jgi:hypothetical protein